MKKILTIIAVLGVIGIGVATYMWNKPHQNMSSASSDLAIAAPALFTAFDTNEAEADAKYLEKIVSVKGKVKSVDVEGKKIVLESDDDMFGVICELDALTEHKRLDFKVGEEVRMKGICTGKLMDVVLVRCVEE